MRGGAPFIARILWGRLFTGGEIMAKYEDKQSGLQQLKAAIKDGNLAPLYIFHGEESFLLHHYLERIKKQRIDELTESFNFHKLTTETFDIQLLADAVENLPMMAEMKLIFLSCRRRTEIRSRRFYPIFRNTAASFLPMKPPPGNRISG